MRSHAKASSAGSSMRQAKGFGRIVRGDGATRGGSGDSSGSSAPSARSRLFVLGLFVLALIGLVLAVASASASKEVTTYIGNKSEGGGKGGELSSPRDVAVNSTGAGGVPAGTIYIADELNNRIQRFEEDGSFVSAWGSSVVTPPANERQSLTVSATAGTYTLAFDGDATAQLPYNANSTQIQSALLGLPSVGGAGLSVSGSGSYDISFFGRFAATNVSQITVDDDNLSGTASTAHPVQGSGSYEICTIAADCLRGTETGAADGSGTAKNGVLSRPQSVAVDNDTGNVYVSDRGNSRVNEYTATGTFIRSFGWGVDASTAGSGYETCPAVDRCTFGVAGNSTGQIGSTFASTALGIAVSPADGNAATGTLFAADTANRRVNTYDLDGTNPSSFGSATQFEASQPRKVVVDSRGIVYASNSKSGGEIERYDSEDANGGGVGFLAPIAQPPLLEGPASEATAGLAVDPDSDAGGPEEDMLYVLRGSWASGGVVQQFGPTNDPGLAIAPAAVDDTHGAGAGFGTFSVQGLGLDDASGRLFVSSSFAGGESAQRVYILDEASAPGASVDPVTDFDAHSATFSGDVDPNGALTGYHFEYVDDAEFQANGFTNAQRYPLTDTRVGDGESPVSVEEEIPHHLVPSTTYHVRLLAKQVFAPVQTASSPVTFTTPGAGPSFEAAATGIETEEATLRAAINPEGQAVTNYHFEWGTSNAYGNPTPATALPSGSQPVAVEELLSGLTPGQTYHYRLLATNATGTTTGADQTFTTPAGPPQFPQRDYEIASQYPTGGLPLPETTGWQVASEDGNALAISAVSPLAHSSLPPLPDDPSSDTLGGVQQYLFSRGSDSWQHRTDVGVGGSYWSANLERDLTTTETDAVGSGFKFEDPRVDPDDQNRTEDVYQWQPNGELTWISRDPRIPVGTPQTVGGELGHASLAAPNGSFTMSADGKTVVFKSQRQLLDVDTTPPATTSFRLYKWEDGQLSFIGARPDGSVPAAGSALGSSGDGRGYARDTVSRDGHRVIFSAQRVDGLGFSRALYVQTDGQPTVEATKAEGVPPLPAGQPYEVTYRGAAADGSRVFFTSSSRLTADSGAAAKEGQFVEPADADLYAYDVATDTLRDLTPRLDGIEGPNVDPAAADRARVLGVAANSADGKRVFFVARGQFPTAPNPEGDLPAANSPNLYMAELAGIEDPIQIRFVATLATADASTWTGNSWEGKSALASTDGSVLGFGSTAGVTGQPLGGTGQLFVYNAKSGTLDCPSCPADGSLPADTVNRYFRAGEEFAIDWQGSTGIRRWVSSDGSVFFTSSTALLPADQNEVNDVYEYRDGALRLISTGTGTADSLLTNASLDGSTVFFNTREALVPQDKEPGINKIYASRVAGGFPYVAPPPPCDFNAGACEGAPSTPPQVAGAGTAAFDGPGNPAPKKSSKRCPKGKRKVRRQGKVRCAPRKSQPHRKRDAKNDRRAS